MSFYFKIAPKKYVIEKALKSGHVYFFKYKSHSVWQKLIVVGKVEKGKDLDKI